MIEIDTPIWKGRKVGLAENKLGENQTVVRILYRTKDDELLYPDHFTIETEKAMTYPLSVIKNVRLRIIPIADLEVMQDL